MVFKIKETVSISTETPLSDIMDWVINGADERDARNDTCGYDDVIDFVHTEFSDF